MSLKTIPWFERKFDVWMPAELLPQLRTRLRGTPARLEETLRGAPADRLTRKPGGQWSAQEHAGHLLDLEPLWIARLGDFIDAHAQLTPADLTNRKTHEANHNARPLPELLRDFRAQRQTMLGRLERIDEAVLTRTLLHPRMKTPMRLMDHLYFVGEHDDHHLSRIEELLKDA